jgi:hypothetical protein
MHTADTQLDPKRRYLCRHVHTDGHRCGSPALRAQNFCYYHDRQRLRNAPLAGRMGIFRMQPIDDRAAIQIALFDILSRLTAGDLDNKRASILLYGLQIASSNLAARDKQQPTTQPIESLTTDHQNGDLAPIEEIPSNDATVTNSVIESEAAPEAGSEIAPALAEAQAAPQPAVIRHSASEPKRSLRVPSDTSRQPAKKAEFYLDDLPDFPELPAASLWISLPASRNPPTP